MPLPPNARQQDNSLDLLFTIGAVILVLGLTWFFYSSKITGFGLRIKHVQLSLWRACYQYFAKPQELQSIDKMLDFIQKNQASGVDFASFYQVLKFVDDYWRYLYALITAGFLTLIWFKPSAPSNFRKRFNTQTLKRAEVVNWPQIAPVLNLDLVNTKLDQGPWAMALSPMEYCKKHKLLIVSRDDAGHYQAKLNHVEASKNLVEQLGPEWPGVDKLPIYLQALFAIFAARMLDDRQAADQLLDNISRSTLGEKIDFSGTKELLAKHAGCKEVQNIIANHAYVTTVMASMLEAARSTGVLATSEFIWLKPIDRRMWYMLNSVGRSTAVAEICGAFSHWLAEKSNQGKLLMPMVDEAVKGLTAALAELVYKPDED